MAARLGWGCLVLMSVVMVLFLAAMVTAVVFDIRYLMASQQVAPQPAANIADNSESLLTERFARGRSTKRISQSYGRFTRAPLIIIGLPISIRHPARRTGMEGLL